MCLPSFRRRCQEASGEAACAPPTPLGEALLSEEPEGERDDNNSAAVLNLRNQSSRVGTGPQYLSKPELLKAVRPTDAQFALCCLYSNRYYTQKRLARASKKLGIPDLRVHDQFEDKRVGLRVCTFLTTTHELPGNVKVAAAVFAFRGTRLTKAGTVQADIQLMKDRDAELYYSQRALKHALRQMQRLHAAHPDVQWAFFTTGHSLGGFAASTCPILCDAILHCVTFESPGLTTFYHRLADKMGDQEYWRERVTTYLAIPNPINMCQKHLGRIVRVHFPRLESRTDATHVLRCLLGTGVRLLNWALAASAGVSAMCLVAGVSRSAILCKFLEVCFSECALKELSVPHVAATAYWGLQSSAAFVATRLGTTLRHVLQQHSMWHMAQAFDPVSGEPLRCVEMAGWPRMERVSETFGVTLRRALVEAFYATSTTEGISVIFDRNALVEARVRALPGYQPCSDLLRSDSSSEGGWLWQLGDMFEVFEEEGAVAATAVEGVLLPALSKKLAYPEHPGGAGFKSAPASSDSDDGEDLEGDGEEGDDEAEEEAEETEVVGEELPKFGPRGGARPRRSKRAGQQGESATDVSDADDLPQPRGFPACPPVLFTPGGGRGGHLPGRHTLLHTGSFGTLAEAESYSHGVPSPFAQDQAGLSFNSTATAASTSRDLAPRGVSAPASSPGLVRLDREAQEREAGYEEDTEGDEPPAGSSPRSRGHQQHTRGQPHLWGTEASSSSSEQLQEALEGGGGGGAVKGGAGEEGEGDSWWPLSSVGMWEGKAL